MQKTINPKEFFTRLRASDLFGGRFSQGQVDGLNVILDEWKRRPELEDLRFLAYILATAYHETAHTMQPIDEYGGEQYFFRMYDPRGDRAAFAKANGNIMPGDGVRFHGRGYVQLTWRSNYEKMGRIFGVDLVGSPELALSPELAVKILFEGMLRADTGFGDFTGASLDQFFSASKDDPEGARRIINGTDKAALIAGNYRDFLEVLQASTP